MKIISLNIEMFKHYDLVLPFLKKETADVVCLQELLETDFEKFQTELGMSGFYKPIEYIYADAYGGPQNIRHGEAIFAKNLSDTKFVYYVGSAENIAHSFEEYFADEKLRDNRVLLSAKVTHDGKEYQVLNTHFTLTELGAATPKQLGDLDKLLEVTKEYPEFFLVGDFNAPRGNETFTRLAEKYTDNIPAHYTTSLDMNIHKRGYLKLQNMVDGLFTTPKYIASNVRLVDGVSDHMAIVADIEMI